MECQKQNWNDKCCCSCKYQRPISGHPWNKNPYTRGSILNTIGYGCDVPDMPQIVLFDDQHGICEMWEEK